MHISEVARRTQEIVQLVRTNKPGDQGVPSLPLLLRPCTPWFPDQALPDQTASWVCSCLGIRVCPQGLCPVLLGSWYSHQQDKITLRGKRKPFGRGPPGLGLGWGGCWDQEEQREARRGRLGKAPATLVPRVSHTLRKYHIREMNHTLTQREEVAGL